MQELQVQHRSHEKTLQFIDESSANDDLQCLRRRFANNRVMVYVYR